MMEVGSWKNFDDIEEHLILDELLILSDQLQKKRRHELRMVAMTQGVDIDEDENEHSNEELPPEVAEAERRFKEERMAKRAAKAAAEGGGMQSFSEGLGYEVVN